MADWKKLNEEFETVLNSLTDQELSDWVESKEAKKKLRRSDLEISAKVQSKRLSSVKLHINDSSQIINRYQRASDLINFESWHIENSNPIQFENIVFNQTILSYVNFTYSKFKNLQTETLRSSQLSNIVFNQEIISTYFNKVVMSSYESTQNEPTSFAIAA